MKATELGVLGARLTELADYYGSKQPTTAALKVWLDALENVSIADVSSVLTDWPKCRAKFPLASEVLAMVNDRVSTRVEESAKRNSADTLDAALARAAAQTRGPESQRIYEQEMAKIRSIMRAGKSHPRAWIEKLLAKEDSGEGLTAVQRWMLQEVEKRIVGPVSSSMSEAALEAKLERQAMQEPGV